jgi:hypothetical protein
MSGCDQLNPPAPEPKPVIGFKRDDEEQPPPPAPVAITPAAGESNPPPMKEPEPAPEPKLLVARISAMRITPTSEKGRNGLLFQVEFEALENIEEVVLAEVSLLDNRNQEFRLQPMRDGKFLRCTKFIAEASAAGAPYSTILWWKGRDGGEWKEAIRGKF